MLEYAIWIDVRRQILVGVRLLAEIPQMFARLEELVRMGITSNPNPGCNMNSDLCTLP